MRHAYLIMAHNEFGMLRRLIHMLDDARNDLYIHIDKKARDFDFESFAKLPQRSRLTFTRRIPVYWGHASQVECEYILFKAALPGHYDYYHLLSGIDLPLASPDAIDAFFEENRGKEFIDFMPEDQLKRGDITARVKYYHFLQSWKRADPRRRRLCLRLEERSLALQKRLGIDRLRGQEIEICKGDNWFSVTDACLRWLVENERRARRLCRFSVCADEVFAQTLLRRSPFFERVSPQRIRCIDWTRGEPYTFREEDLDELMRSGCLWARKITETGSGRLPGLLYERVMGAPEPNEA